MPRLIARYPYLPTAGGGMPIVWMGLTVNERFMPVPAAPAPERMRSGLSLQAARSVEYSAEQRVVLQLFSRTAAELVGPAVTLTPEIDSRLDDPARFGAEGPWYQYPWVLLGQDFLENVSVVLVGSRQITIFFDYEAEDD
jgi:hypothetical protein